MYIGPCDLKYIAVFVRALHAFTAKLLVLIFWFLNGPTWLVRNQWGCACQRRGHPPPAVRWTLLDIQPPRGHHRQPGHGAYLDQSSGCRKGLLFVVLLCAVGFLRLVSCCPRFFFT